MGDVTHVASEMIQGYRVVRAALARPTESERFRQACPQHRTVGCMVKTSAKFHPDPAVGDLLSTMAVVLFLVPLSAGASPRRGILLPT